MFKKLQVYQKDFTQERKQDYYETEYRLVLERNYLREMLNARLLQERRLTTRRFYQYS